MAASRAARDAAIAPAQARGEEDLPQAWDEFDEFAGLEADIAAAFKRKMAALRQLPPGERAGAFRAARNWLSQMQAALRDQRAARRAGRRMIRLYQPRAP